MPDRLQGTPRLRLPDSVRRVEFISDLHLHPDLPRTVKAFGQYLADCRADVLFILGDLFETWVGDDLLDEPFEAECARMLRDCASRRPLYVMRGNRDFLLGPRFFADTGCLEAADPLAVEAFGQTVLLSHGDALCLDDTEYQRFRAQVRSAAWRSQFLAQPLPQRMALAAQMRAASRARQASAQAETYADVDAAAARQALADAGCRLLVHGHTHRPASEAHEGWSRHVLSDWDLDHGHRAECLVWTADGWSREPLGAGA